MLFKWYYILGGKYMQIEKFAKKLANLRKEKGLTQQELGDKAGVSAKTISKWEMGQSLPDITYIDSLAKALGVGPSIFFDNEKDGASKESKLPFISVAVSFGIGVCVFILNSLDKITVKSSISLLAISLIVISFSKIINKE